METLGHLVWYGVANPDCTYDDLRSHIGERPVFERLRAPRPPAPADVFRKLAEDTMRWESEELTHELMLSKADSDEATLRFVMVHQQSAAGVLRSATKAGDVVFYRPPKGRPEKARLRTAVSPELAQSAGPATAYATLLRNNYDRRMTQLDAQAVRRFVRHYLSAHHALHMDGVYFLLREEEAVGLSELLALIGGSWANNVPLPWDDNTRSMVTSYFTHAALRDEVNPLMTERFNEIHLVSDEARSFLSTNSKEKP